MAAALLINVMMAAPGSVPTPAEVRSSLQPQLPAGKWLNGTFSMSNWWSYDGKQYVGNPYSQSIAFNFS